MSEHDKDLPLLANTDDILVSHYCLELACSFEERRMTGYVVVFLESTDKKVNDSVSEFNNSGKVNSAEQPVITKKKMSHNGEETKKPFNVIFDACDISVHSVQEVLMVETFQLSNLINKEYYQRLRSAAICAKKLPIHYTVGKWCIKIWKDDVFLAKNFPKVLMIHYHTNSSGASLTWAQDQNSRYTQQRLFCSIPIIYPNH